MSEEWGPWIEHDGKHCPIGKCVHAIAFDGLEWFGIAGQNKAAIEYYYGGWFFDLDEAESDHVFKYRIRKPKGLSILQDILRNPERELEGA